MAGGSETPWLAGSAICGTGHDGNKWCHRRDKQLRASARDWIPRAARANIEVSRRELCAVPDEERRTRPAKTTLLREVTVSEHVSSVIQIAGSLLILVPFVLVQMNRWRPESLTYIWLNLAGSTVLALDAWRGHQWGFLLLEGSWAVVSCISLVRKGTDRAVPSGAGSAAA